jgi:Tol biopolymer transport system component
MRLPSSRAAIGALALCSTGCASGAGRVAAFPDLPADGAPAVMFAPGIVSTGDVFASTFTPDGRTVVFTKFSPPKPMTLMVSTFDGARWTTPATLPFSGAYRDLDPAFSPDGRRLFFSSARPSGPSPADTASGVDTWYVARTKSGWSEPIRLSEPVNSAATDMYPSMTANGVLYFDSSRPPAGRRLVYRATPGPDGRLGDPQLVDAVNGETGASNLFVDADERYVVFGAVRPGGAGRIDLWISWREGGGWTTPRNVGPLVNTADDEFCPFVSRDGKYLYFTRVITANGTSTRNVFVVRFDQLRERLAKGS